MNRAADCLAGMMKPSELLRNGTWSLTGDRNTELVIEAMARACVDEVDAWVPVRLHHINLVNWSGRGPAVRYDTDDAAAEWMEMHRRIYGDQAQPDMTDPRMSMVQASTTGRFAAKLVESGWAVWAVTDGWLAVELTPMALGEIGRLA